MSGAPPPFDPSKPFTREGGPPAFDPSKPFTTETPQTGAPTWYGRAAHGFEAPFVGLNTLASEVEQHLPFISKETKASDLAAAQSQQKQFEREGSPSFSGWELVGNLANPLNYLAGGAATSVPGAIGRAALSGAASAAVQPSPTEDYGINKIAQTAIGGVLGGVTGAAMEPLARAIAGDTPAALDQFIRDKFQRAVKPVVKKTFSQMDRYSDQVASAISSIVRNKAGLKLTDEFSQPVEGLPQSLDQFAQAIDQTKSAVFSKYDAMARSAGGAQVDLSPVVAELQKLSGKTTLNDLSPGIVSYANALAATLAKRGTYSTVEAQEAIQHLNKTLEAFYRNPTYETASHAGVSALIANNLRRQLDSTIERAVGPGYQELKNQYGALRALENDVVRRAIVTGRQNVGGGLMGNIGDIVSAEDVIHGVLHFSPATMATGALLKGFTTITKHLRSPNRAIKRLFQAADRQAQPASPYEPTRQTISQAIRQTAPVASAVSDLYLTNPQPR